MLFLYLFLWYNYGQYEKGVIIVDKHRLTSCAYCGCDTLQHPTAENSFCETECRYAFLSDREEVWFPHQREYWNPPVRKGELNYDKNIRGHRQAISALHIRNF